MVYYNDAFSNYVLKKDIIVPIQLKMRYIKLVTPFRRKNIVVPIVKSINFGVR